MSMIRTGKPGGTDRPGELRYSFHCIAYNYSCADWYGLRDNLKNVPWDNIFKLRASSAASEFCEWVQVGINIYIPHRKYQV